MAIYKLSFIFNQPNRGWTESFYREAASASAAIITPDFGGQPSLPMIMRARSPLTVLTAIKSALVGSAFEYSVRTVNLAGSASYDGLIQGNPDVASTSAVLKLTAVGAGVRHLWMRGLQDRYVRRTMAGADVSSDIQFAINDYQFFMLFLGLKMKKFPTAGVERARVNRVRPDPVNPNMSLVTIDPLINAGIHSVFTGIPKSLCGFPRDVISAPRIQGTNDFRVPYRLQTLGGVDPSVIPPKMFMRTFTNYDYPNIGLAGFLRFGEHDTGRPTNLPRGRKTAQCRAQ